MLTKRLLFETTAFAILLTLGARAQGVPSYTVTDLGTLGGIRSEATAINANGQVVGQATTANGYSHAVLFGTTNIDLGTLGGNYSRAYDINASGQVIGEATTANGSFHAVRFGITNIDLGSLGGNYSRAHAINASGEVVGLASGQDGFNQAVVFGATNTNLGTLGGNHTWANDINTSGQIVGVSTTVDLNFHAVLFGTTNTDLGTLGGSSSSANAINASGQIVGSAQTVDQKSHAVVFGATNKDLGTLSGGFSQANAINNNGQVVGISSSNYYDIGSDPTLRAFLYQDSIMRDLNSLISPTSGWMLNHASDINDAGLIVGPGLNPSGQTHAFLLIPIPAIQPPIPPAVLERPVAPPITVIRADPAIPSKGLVVLIHGWNSDPTVWASDMKTDIKKYVEAGWDVGVIDWQTFASDEVHGPGLALRNALVIGPKIGQDIADLGYDKVQLVGHSAGAWLADTAADKLRQLKPNVQIQTTFLDAYVPYGLGSGKLGSTSNWSEQYVDDRFATGFPPFLFTNSILSHAYNFDVTHLDPNSFSLNPLQNNPIEAHGWPYRWYAETVAPAGLHLTPDTSVTYGLGF